MAVAVGVVVGNGVLVVVSSAVRLAAGVADEPGKTPAVADGAAVVCTGLTSMGGIFEEQLINPATANNRQLSQIWVFRPAKPRPKTHSSPAFGLCSCAILCLRVWLVRWVRLDSKADRRPNFILDADIHKFGNHVDI